jgi:threonine synthase
MKYLSTEGRTPATTFRSALFAGLAPDGGLYVPESLPRLSREMLEALPSHSLQSIGKEVLSAFIDDIPAAELGAVVEKAWMFPIPLVHLEENIFLLELFHGPTLAFKDVGARFLALALSHYLQESHQHTSIAVATSGDTGSAVANGFYNVPNISVYVLYPSGKISPLQEQQITTLGRNIHALEIAGTFDDCQRLVKEALGDEELVKQSNLTTANSINIGRLLPQVCYYVWGIAQWQREFMNGARGGGPTIVVPSGNFGNLTAGVFARAMGTPIPGLVAATNVNDVGGIYLCDGVFAPRSSVQTYSNAMDVGNPSNIARLRWYFGNEHEPVRKVITTDRATDDETLTEIKRVYERTGKVVDPHTAVGLVAARKQPRNRPVIVTATAHPAKFPEVIARAIGERFPMPEQLQEAFRRSKHSVPLPAEFALFKKHMLTEGGPNSEC